MKNLDERFNEWWESPACSDPASRKELAREAFIAGFESGISRGFDSGKDLGARLAKLEAKIRQLEK